MTFALGRWWSLRLIALAYLCSFLSLRVQVDGLMGSRGILPAAVYVEAARASLGPSGWLQLPTLCWWGTSDATLHRLCDLGALAAAAAAAGFAQAAALAACWICSLSLQAVGQDFLSFQWDILLLETGFLALWYAPLSIRPVPPSDSPPGTFGAPRLARWAVLWLLFRLMFASGMVKLLSGDPRWRDLSALEVHYETQPLPTWIGWWAHHLPGWFHRVSCAAMFAIELGAPWTAFLPWRTARIAGFLAIAGLMALIAITGNYGFFNFLTVAIALPLLDDGAWPRPLRDLPARLRPSRGPAREWPAAVAAVPLAAAALAGAIVLSSQMRLGLPWPRSAVEVYRALAPFRIANGYGLFAVMTAERREIVIEGSADGRTWRPYAFRWKPSDPAGRPRFVAPHMPRLDWQMWFAALGTPADAPWFASLCARLLEGEPAVVALLAGTPFPGAPPRLVRARIARWTFARPGEAGWWTVGTPELWLPPVRLR